MTLKIKLVIDTETNWINGNLNNLKVSHHPNLTKYYINHYKPILSYEQNRVC